tara:strand:+ start:2497 stop:4581 length:2085 start_codon:yes stop_codon:yes gene_type:complete
MAHSKIGSIGINTGIQLAGVTTIATLNASDNTLSVGGTVNFVSDVSIGGTVSIAGTLTYEDVTNVDSVGIITARSEIRVGSGITLSKDGNGFFTGVTTATTFVGALTGNVTGTIQTAAQANITSLGTLTSLDVSGGLGIAESLFHIGDTDTRVAFPADDRISFETAGSEAVRIDGAGRLLVGTDTARQTRAGNASYHPDIQLESEVAGLSLGKFNDSDGPSRLTLQKARGSKSSPTIVQDDDEIGSITFSGWDGDTFTNAAQIRSEVEGTPGDDDMPGNLIFYTTSDGSSVSSERLRISSDGKILVNHTTGRGVGNANVRLLQVEGTGGESAITCVRNSSNTSGAGLMLGKSRSNVVGGTTIVNDDDKLGVISFCGADGTDLISVGAQITGEVDGTPGANDMPGRIVFKTTSDGSASSSEKMRLTQDGRLGIGQNAPAGLLHLSSGTSGDCELILEADTDNNEEADNPRILFRQDGGSDQNAIGVGGTVYDALTDNALCLMNSVPTSGGIIFKTNNASGYQSAVARLSIRSDGTYKDHKSGCDAVKTLTNVPCWFGRQDTAHNVGTSAWTTIINLGNNVVNNTNGGWNESNGVFTVPANCQGTYFVYGGAAIDDVQDSDIVRGGFSKNDAAPDFYAEQRALDEGSNIIVNSGTLTYLVYLDVGDTIKFQVYHNEGSTEPTEPNRCFFGGHRISA